MPTSLSRPWGRPLVGGCLCLDFTNTAAWHGSARQVERLAAYADLVSWALVAGAIRRRDADGLLRHAEREPGRADSVLAEAIRLRELMFAVFRPIARGSWPPVEVLDRWERVFRRSLGRTRIVPVGSGLTRVWAGEGRDLEGLLWPSLQSAEDLLLSDQLDRVRECRASSCGWLFLDQTGGRRRWCDMRTCGNRAKARRFYQRRRA
jgi:predicted RNA-binding Zn ribbon-like protein